MSRHRNIRSMNYSEEYDGYDDVYGHSVEDDYCISPSDAAFIYDREGPRGQQKISAFFKSDDDIAEEDETADKVANLDDIERAKLNSCIEKVKSLLEDVKISEQDLVYLILKHNFEVEKVIDIILSSNRLIQQETKPEPPKEKDLTKNKINIPKFFKKFEVPSLFSDSSNPDLSKKTDVPELINNLSDSSSHSSLSSLVSSHLKISGKSPTFNNLEKLDNFAENDWEIDLTSALCNSSSAQLNLSKNRAINNEIFQPQFVNCSSTKSNIILKDFCKIDISDILLLNNILETSVSEFGKVITHRFRFHAPNLNFYEEKYESDFNFNIPSPDDLILKHLRRK